VNLQVRESTDQNLEINQTKNLLNSSSVVGGNLTQLLLNPTNVTDNNRTGTLPEQNNTNDDLISIEGEPALVRDYENETSINASRLSDMRKRLWLP
jgi:hypothetical protein